MKSALLPILERPKFLFYVKKWTIEIVKIAKIWFLKQDCSDFEALCLDLYCSIRVSHQNKKVQKMLIWQQQQHHQFTHQIQFI